MAEKEKLPNYVIELFKHLFTFPEKAPLIVSVIKAEMLPEIVRPLFTSIKTMVKNHRPVNSQTIVFHSENHYTNQPDFYNQFIRTVNDMPNLDLSIATDLIINNYQKQYVAGKLREINSLLQYSRQWNPEVVVDRAMDIIIELEKKSDSDILPKSIVSDSNAIIPFVRPDLQRLMGGKVRGELLTIAGESKHGKSRYALNLAYEDLQAGWKVDFFNIEMKNLQAMQILMSLEARVDSETVIKRPGNLTKEQREALETKYAEFKANYVDTGMFKMYQSLNRVEEINAALVRDKPDVAYIDWWQLMEMPEPGMNKAQGLPIIISSILKTCKKLNIALVGVAQIEIRSRSGWAKRPRYDDISDSSFFKKASADVLAVFRPYQVFQNQPQYYHIFEVIYMISRFGQPGYTINFIDPAYARFGQKNEIPSDILNNYKLESGLVS
ncbi:MAG: DnaB-like helicase C-terminal domain-containing protein [Candidatus Pacearchaeota archaeon]